VIVVMIMIVLFNHLVIIAALRQASRRMTKDGDDDDTGRNTNVHEKVRMNPQSRKRGRDMIRMINLAIRKVEMTISIEPDDTNRIKNKDDSGCHHV
jgi:hypothetical protein